MKKLLFLVLLFIAISVSCLRVGYALGVKDEYLNTLRYEMELKECAAISRLRKELNDNSR